MASTISSMSTMSAFSTTTPSKAGTSSRLAGLGAATEFVPGPGAYEVRTSPESASVPGSHVGSAYSPTIEYWLQAYTARAA